MISKTYAEYRRTLRDLLSRPDVSAPQSALELGALLSDQSLLACEELRSVPRRIGVNLGLDGKFEGFRVQRGDARRLDFPSDSFDLVMSASMLEHVPEFWLAVSEMKRVLAPGGFLIVSTPGFGQTPAGNLWRRLAFRARLPDVLKRATLTMRIHDAPHDYYRFSEYCYRDVILSGLEDIQVWSVLTPPRLYGFGRKPCPTGRY